MGPLIPPGAQQRPCGRMHAWVPVASHRTIVGYPGPPTGAHLVYHA